MGLILFLQPKKESSFALANSLWLLGLFGMVHSVREFIDMWGMLRPAQTPWLPTANLAILAASYLLLLEFGRRSVKALCEEIPSCRGKLPWLYGRALVPALLLLVVVLSELTGGFNLSAETLSRLLLCFPAALMSGLTFIGYAIYKEDALTRLKAKKYFLLTGTAFLAYAVLGGLIPGKGGLFPSNLLNSEVFLAAVGLPVQLFRAVCAAAIFGGIIGVVRIFRESELQSAQQELLDIIEFFPDATFVIDKDRKVIAWNRALEKMTGVPKADMLGKGDFAYSVPFYGEPRPILIDLIGTAHPEAQKLYEYVAKRPDGTINAEVFVPSLYNGEGAHVWVTASPLQDKDGNIYGAIESVRDVTDRKTAQQALQRSEAQYRALIETTNTGFLIINKEGRVEDANQEYVRLTGHKKLDEILGKSVLDWTADYEKEKSARAIRECDKTGYIRDLEIDYTDKQGVITPIELNATSVDIGGEPRILTLCRDITDRRNAEKLLKESEDKFRTLTEKSLVGVYLVQDNTFLYTNPKHLEIFGYGEGELTGHKGPKDVVYPEDWPIVEENLRKRMAGEISDINYVFRGVKKDGTVITIEVFGSKTMYMGRPAVIGTMIDITERKKAQDALRESEERYRTLVNNAQVGIVVHQMGLMKFVNDKMARIVRVPSPEDLIGRNVLEFMHPDFREFVKERVRRAATAGITLPPAEEKLLAADGAVLDVETNTVPITYQGLPCAMAIVQDITPRKKIEEELKAAHLQLLLVNAGLEKRVEERTVQLEELNGELEAFSYSAAHDMKAPLRRVNIFAEMLEKEAARDLNGESRALLHNIRKSVTQMTDLVEGLLKLSTTSKKPLNLEDVDLAALLDEAIAELTTENAGRPIEWNVAALPSVQCDKAMMKQVLTNLLGNAVKYSRGSNPAKIDILYELKDGMHVIGVKDNGVGFSMEYSDKLFAVFQRLHKAEEFEGTGIGLSTVKRIITRHGGKVGAESSPGKGATFYFRLPAAQAQ